MTSQKKAPFGLPPVQGMPELDFDKILAQVLANQKAGAAGKAAASPDPDPDVTGGQDDLIAAALALGNTWKEAAELAKVSEATIGRRMKRPAFRDRVADLRRAAVDQAVNVAANALTKAMRKLESLMEQSKDEGIQLRAAVALLEQGLRYQEHGNAEDYLAWRDTPVVSRPARWRSPPMSK